ncbi:MAG: HAD family hydrolase [Theionarchaea archaeon]|nr:HAD family hydrolase [Theionarchaea archaeon]
MIKAVTFDLWGTLILDSLQYEKELTRKREDLLYGTLEGLSSREDIRKAMEYARSGIERTRKTMRDVPTSEHIRLLQSFLKVDSDLEPAYTEAILHMLPPLNPHSREVLTKVKSVARVGLISNTGITPGGVIRKALSDLGIWSFFDVGLFSNEVGYLKPHPKIFEVASRELEVSPSETLHVGDDRINDIEGASAVGMSTLLVEEPGDLRQVLEVVFNGK